MKICFKMKQTLSFNVPWNVQPIKTCFGNIIRKLKTQFPCLYSRGIFLCCHYGIVKHNSYAKSPKLFAENQWKFLGMALSIILLKERCNHDASLNKQKPCHGAINNRPRGIIYQIIRFISHFSLRLHMQFWKKFHGMVLCSADSYYYKK